MEYRMNIISMTHDLNAFSEYVIKSNDRCGIIMIEFEEKDASDIRKIYCDSIKEKYKQIESTEKIGVVSKDKTYNFITENGIEKADIKAKTSFALINKMFKVYCKSQKDSMKVSNRVKKILKDNSDIKLIEDFTLSNFKKYTYIYQNKHYISCRIKKSKKENQPIILYFHGGGNGGNDNRKALYEFGLPRICLRKKDCTIIVPQTPNSFDSDRDCIDSAKEIIDYIAGKVKADKNRIYVFGGSAGGRSTWNMAWNYPDYIACAMPLMGENLYVSKMHSEDFDRIKNLPLWVVHASNDNAVDIKLDDYCVEQLKKIGGNVRYSRWDKYGHSVYRPFYRREKWVDWMFDQSLDKR